MQVHPLAAIFPLLDDADMEKLADDILENGLLHPIITWKGMLIDGRNRLRACEIAGVAPHFAEGDFSSEHDVKKRIISMNIRRRHLDRGQIAMLGEELRPGYEVEAKEKQHAAGAHGAEGGRGKTKTLHMNSCEGFPEPELKKREHVNARIARELGVGEDTVRIAHKVKTEAPELADKVMSGEMKLNAAHNKVKPKKPKKSDIPDGRKQAAVHAVLDGGKSRDEAAAEFGLSEGALQQAIERERGRREPAVDPQTLPMSAQEKLEAAIRQEKRKLQAEFEKVVADELKRALDLVLPDYNRRLTEYHQVIKARKGIMTRATYRMILSWLHPDRILDPAQKEAITKAFHAFTNLELVLCNEKEMPTNPASIPRTHEEWAQRRAEMKTKRKKQSNSVQHR